MTAFKNLFKKKQHTFVTDLSLQEAIKRIDGLVDKRKDIYINDKSILGKVEADGSFKLRSLLKTTDVRRPSPFNLVGSIYTDNDKVCVYFKITAELMGPINRFYLFMSMIILFFVQKDAFIRWIIWIIYTLIMLVLGVYQKNKEYNKFKTLLEKALYS